MAAIREYVSKAEQHAAHLEVHRAVKAGILIKPTSCSWCGEDKLRIHGHHPDYARPLMVVWICARCHKKHHHEYEIERLLHGTL